MHQQQFLYGVAQHVTVVTDQQNGAFVGLQGNFHGVAHVQVQVVGRLVQHQQIGPLPNHHGQGETRFLAAGERCDRTGGTVTAKVETTEKIENFLLSCARTQTL